VRLFSLFFFILIISTSANAEEVITTNKVFYLQSDAYSFHKSRPNVVSGFTGYELVQSTFSESQNAYIFQFKYYSVSGYTRTYYDNTIKTTFQTAGNFGSDGEPLPEPTPEPEPTPQEICETNNDYWYNNQCNTEPEPTQEQLTCEANNDLWFNNQCFEQSSNCSTAPTTMYYNCTTSSCDISDLYAFSGCEYENTQDLGLVCSDSINPSYKFTKTGLPAGVKPLLDLTTVNPADSCPAPEPTPQEACEANNDYWYNNQCNDSPETEPEPTDPTPQEQCEANGKQWTNNQCLDGDISQDTAADLSLSTLDDGTVVFQTDDLEDVFKYEDPNSVKYKVSKELFGKVPSFCEYEQYPLVGIYPSPSKLYFDAFENKTTSLGKQIINLGHRFLVEYGIYVREHTNCRVAITPPFYDLNSTYDSVDLTTSGQTIFFLHKSNYFDSYSVPITTTYIDRGIEKPYPYVQNTHKSTANSFYRESDKNQDQPYNAYTCESYGLHWYNNQCNTDLENDTGVDTGGGDTGGGDTGGGTDGGLDGGTDGGSNPDDGGIDSEQPDDTFTGTNTTFTFPTESWWQSNYENGLNGIWETHSQSLKETTLLTWLDSWHFPSGGSYPSWTFNFNLLGNDYGSRELSLSPEIWLIIKSLIILTSIFAFRALVFGG